MIEVVSEHDRIELLEASKLEGVNKLSHFLGAVTDRMGGNEHTSRITKISRGPVRRENIFLFRGETDLMPLQETISKRYYLGKSFFKVYQTSGKNTRKWDLHDNLDAALKYVGEI